MTDDASVLSQLSSENIFDKTDRRSSIFYLFLFQIYINALIYIFSSFITSIEEICIIYDASRSFDIAHRHCIISLGEFDNLIINERRTRGKNSRPDKWLFTLPRRYLSPKLLRSILLAGINRRTYEVSRII